MIRRINQFYLRAALIGFMVGLLATPFHFAKAQPQTPAATEADTSGKSTVQAIPAAPLSAGAERVFAQARPKLLQIRTLTKAARSQSSIGSGFLVASDIAVTNYHVVSQKVMQADAYDLQWLNMDNQQGGLQVIAVDVANDLALIKLSVPQPALGTFSFASDEPSRGERVYSLGRPLDLGFHIIEGTHNGRVDGDFNRRFLFSGAINSGMSGGPAVNARGEVYGVNVAKNLRGELISYVVPLDHVKAFAQKAASSANATPTDNFLPTMTEQLRGHQERLAKALFEKPLPSRTLGRYMVPDELPPLLRCWAGTNREDAKALYTEDRVQCKVDAGVYIDQRLYTGTMQVMHTLLSSKQLNRLQFQSLVAGRYQPAQLGMIPKHLTPDRCTDEFIEQAGLPLRVTLCVQAMKKFPNLYDFGISMVSQDANLGIDNGMRQTLLTSLHMDGVTWETGMRLSRQYLASIRLAPTQTRALAKVAP